jgi:hypothetical protein
MHLTEAMANERIGDRLREAEGERRAEHVAHARAVARRARIRGALNLVAGHVALALRRRVVRPA